MNIVLFGAPGSGKGVQAEKIVAKYKLPLIATGDIFREEIKKNTELGIKAKEFMDRGDLVPDDIVTGMIEQRLKQPDCAKGFIMDGIPRTIVQAEALDKITKVDVVIDLEVSDEVIIERLSGRRYCENCLAVYHVKNIPPKKEGICDKCGAELSHREDDKPEAVKKRLEEYSSKTKPLKDFYKEIGILKEIDGTQSIGKVFEDVEKAISEIK